MRLTIGFAAPALACAAFLALAGYVTPGVAVASSKPDESAQTEAKPDYSKGFRKEAPAVQKLVQEKKWPEALEGIKKLEALPDRTKDDNRVILLWKLVTAQGLDDKPTFFGTMEQMLKEGLAQPDQIGPWHQNLAAWYNSQKDLPNTLLNYRAYIDATPDVPPADMVTLGRLYQQSGDEKQGLEWINKAISTAEAKGEQPEEMWFQLLDHSYVALKDDAARLANLEALVRRYPKSEYYSRILAMFEAGAKDDQILMLDAYRLATSDTGLGTVGEYLRYAATAIDLGSPGEAVRALQKGMAAGIVPSAGTNQQLLQEAQTAVARDKKELPKDAIAAAKNPNGEIDAKVGLGFYSVGDWAKAADAVKRGLGKGGVKRVDDANLLLGAALVQLGKYDEAKQAFAAAAAAARNDYMRQLASLWTAFADRKAGGTGAG